MEFLSRFGKDIDNLKDQRTKKSLIRIFEQIELASKIEEVPNILKLKGFKDAYRIRVGDYRLGLFVNGDLVQLARFVHRKDIYKQFP